MSTSPNAKLIVISGPSGVGKTTIVDQVIQKSTAVFSVSATTRAPRVHEHNGHDYHFIDRATFDELKTSGQILEWAEYGGNLYGTLASEVEPILADGTSVLLDIENEGARQIRSSFPEAVLIFVAPPDLDSLADRLHSRGDTPDSDVRLRLAAAESQIVEAPALFDHIVVNDDLERAVTDVLDILRAAGTEVSV